MNSAESTRAYPPETLEGWYALHQIFTLDRRGPIEGARNDTRGGDATPRVELTPQGDPAQGWRAWARLVGSRSQVMAVHFGPTLDSIGASEADVRHSLAETGLSLTYSFLSVTEAGLYHLTAELARETAARGGTVGDETYVAEVARRVAKERESSHVRRRLYPILPDDMPYVCFYPMSKRRDPGQNWYTLSLDERSRLMQAHGKTGRRYAGRVLQIITGAIGFDAWEWGVTLFARDPLDFKKLVTDMRFDEVSANYATFGDFYVGRIVPWSTIQALVETR